MKTGIFGRKQNGFTIAEMAVVIVIIGILATIVAVAYPGYMEQTRDNERKSDLEQISAALKAYAIQENTYMETGSGCGFFGEGNGWIASGPNAYFPESILGCLEAAGVVDNREDFIDPSGCLADTGSGCGTYQSEPATAYMKATCETDGKPMTYIFAHLETEPRKDGEIDTLCDVGSVDGFATGTPWGTDYGMNYYVRVE